MTDDILFRAYVKFADGKPDEKWEGLTYSKAHWRYHWIKRQFFAGIYRNVKSYGFQSQERFS
jgi:hypothetical protein